MGTKHKGDETARGRNDHKTLCDQSKKLPAFGTIWKVLTARYERTGPSGLYNIIKLLPFRLHTLIFCFHFGIVSTFNLVFKTTAQSRDIQRRN